MSAIWNSQLRPLDGTPRPVQASVLRTVLRVADGFTDVLNQALSQNEDGSVAAVIVFISDADGEPAGRLVHNPDTESFDFYAEEN